jgi:hypothetical protein
MQKEAALDFEALFPGQTLPELAPDELKGLLGLNPARGKGKFVEYEADSNLKDFENIPLKEDLISYVLREVRPYVADAWIDRDTLDEQDGGIGKVGYEINFNREFFQYQPPRPLARDRCRACGGGETDHGAVAGGDGVNELIHEIRDLIQSARRAVVHSVDLIQVMTNFEIGRRIVEHDSSGEERAQYGKALLKELSAALTAEFGRGFSQTESGIHAQVLSGLPGSPDCADAICAIADGGKIPDGIWPIGSKGAIRDMFWLDSIRKKHAHSI